jgi:hypothetical protein
MQKKKKKIQEMDNLPAPAFLSSSDDQPREKVLITSDNKNNYQGDINQYAEQAQLDPFLHSVKPSDLNMSSMKPAEPINDAIKPAEVTKDIIKPAE